MYNSPVQRQYKISALAPAPGSPPRIATSPAGRDRITLLRLQLSGYYSLSDGFLYPCKTLQIYPNQIALSCQVAGQAGDAVKLDLDLLGSLHGTIEGRMAAGLRIDIAAPYQDHIAEKLAWFKSCIFDAPGKEEAAKPQNRGAERIVPRQINCFYTIKNGDVCSAAILNISRSGAALKSDCIPPVGTEVSLGEGARRGLIVRHLEGGFAIAFLLPILAHEFGPDMVI